MACTILELNHSFISASLNGRLFSISAFVIFRSFNKLGLFYKLCSSRNKWLRLLFNFAPVWGQDPSKGFNSSCFLYILAPMFCLWLFANITSKQKGHSGTRRLNSLGIKIWILAMFLFGIPITFYSLISHEAGSFVAIILYSCTGPLGWQVPKLRGPGQETKGPDGILAQSLQASPLPDLSNFSILMWCSVFVSAPAYHTI